MAPKDDRKQQILEAAISLFAAQGYYKTTTAHVAKVAGITQPYVFHFFKSKEELFVAVVEQSFYRILDVFVSVKAPPEQLVQKMGEAFQELLLTHRDETLLSMQAFTTSEPMIRDKVREGFANIHRAVKQLFEAAGLPNPGLAASLFVGTGLTIVMSEVLELPEISPYCTEE
jgi:AcrR family transcriptional regulator